MIVDKVWCVVQGGRIVKKYHMILLFGFIPIYIHIDG